jgi:hypothetical protein
MRDVIALSGGNWLRQSRWVDTLHLARTNTGRHRKAKVVEVKNPKKISKFPWRE